MHTYSSHTHTYKHIQTHIHAHMHTYKHTHTNTHTNSGGDLAPSLGGRKNFSRTKISEFLFSRPKILTTFFSVSFLCKMSYMTLSSQEKALFQKRIPSRHLFFYSVRAFTPIPQHFFSKYWGDQCMGRPPPQIFWGDRPPSPP